MSGLSPTPETQSGDELLAELADDFLRRHRAGERPSVDEYATKHPELADRIRNLFPAMMAMEQPAGGATFDFAPATERVGATIGRYKLLERIGEGGFGVVYMAEQQHPVRRKVAVKVIKPGIDTRQVIARFEAERQALALMDHENIAKVLDAGATDSGRPYFVMELVHGVSITDFCDRNQLPTRERLELFVQICRAVQHAHTKGIIHRDIKPTNVLVTLHEGVPVPKVIDFGVAKATGQQLTDKTLFTHFAQMVGTPLYMSPEQAEMTCIDVDTRSDVYSLGVLLYELLTGTTPLDKDRLKQAAFDEVRRIIREDEPPSPSTRLSTMGEHARSISAAQRKIDPKQLGRIVRGELDWIVMKALEKERARRYETANELIMDLQRFLHDEPVLASPPSPTYRLRKFARRNKATVVATAAVLATLVAGIIGTTLALLEVENARRAEAQRADGELRAKLEAQQQEAETRAMLDFVERKVFAAAGPHVDQTSLDYDRTLLKVLEQMLAMRKATLGPDHPDVHACAKSLALLYFDRHQHLCQAGRFQEAVADIARSLELDPGNHWRWYRAAALYLYTGDIERYRAACCQMLDRFEMQAANDMPIAERTAKTCALAPASVPDFSRAVWLAQRSVNGTEKMQYYGQFVLGKGLTDYRGERLVQAIEWLERFAPEAVGTDYDATAFAALAMAHHRLGNADTARQSLAFARAIIAEKPDDWLHGEFWNWMHAEILLREAEGLMGAVSPDELAAARQLRWERDLTNPKPGQMAYHAPKLLLTGDTVTYRRVCARLIAKFRDTNEPHTAYLVARICALAPDTVSDPAGLVELAERAVRAESTPHYLHTLGLAHYRAGHFDEAIELLHKSIEEKWNANAANWLALAMAHHRLGRADDARKWFDQAARWMENTDALRSIHGIDSLACRVLRREAEALLGLRQQPGSDENEAAGEKK